MEEIEKFIAEHILKTKKLNKDLHLAWWDSYTKGRDEDYKKYSELRNNYKKIYNDKNDLMRIKNWLSHSI